MGISQLGKGSQRGAHLLKELPHSSVTLSDCLLGESGSQAMIPPGPHLDKVAWLYMPLATRLLGYACHFNPKSHWEPRAQT